jgi:hypothetical protein
MQSISQPFSVTTNANAAVSNSPPHCFSPSVPVGEAPASRIDAGPQALAARGWGGDLTLLKQVSTPRTCPLQPSSFSINPKAIKVKRCKHATLTAGRLHMAERPDWAATFVGLTYRGLVGWNPLHITVFLKGFRAWCAKREIECRYLWVAEMQKRGAIHYHLVMFHPKKFSIPFPDGRRGWWPHGSSSISKGIRNAVHYMAKYLSKGDFAQFPKGARTYGCGGIEGTAKLEMRWYKLPKWVKDVSPLSEASDAFKRVVGGFMSPVTGQMIPSPWEVIFTGGSILCRLKAAAG